MKIVREPAVAGMFYPADPHELSEMVDQFLQSSSAPSYRPKALIVPHAGYVYSGPIAATAYNTLKPLRGQISRVVLLGPSHHVGFRGLAYSEAQHFLTPLGAVEQNPQDIERIRELPQIIHLEMAHLREHSLEVQLPFLQRCLGNFALVPLVVGDATAKEVSEVLEKLWGGDETLIVISSDLSHYLPYEEAQIIDHATSEAITHLDSQHISSQQACGSRPLIGLLESAKRHHLKASLLDLRNSGDTAGDKERVVGYGAYALH